MWVVIFWSIINGSPYDVDIKVMQGEASCLRAEEAAPEFGLKAVCIKISPVEEK